MDRASWAPIPPLPRPEDQRPLAATQRIERHYQMHCRRCGATWDAAYELVTFHDGDGDHELFFRHSLPAMAPWSSSCPTCAGQRLTVLPFRAQAPKLHTNGHSDREIQPA
jgi:hypothetical protein